MDDDRRGAALGHYEIVAIVASAGGHAAVATVLRGLPDGFSVPIVVVQHLGPQSNGTAEHYRRHVTMPVETLHSGSRLTQGMVLIAPPRVFVGLLPDGSFALKPCERGARDNPLDYFLDSVARSFGPHALGVVLTGMGTDGAAGARQLRDAKGRVIVQSERSAEHPEMPRAAIKAGAADLVVPVSDVGPVVGDIVAGTPRPKLRSEIAAIEALFAGPGPARAQLRQVEWSESPLGPVMDWPQSLWSTVRTVLASRIAMVVHWGPDWIQIGNDAYLSLVAETRSVQGKPASAVWVEQWTDMLVEFDRIVRTGEATRYEDQQRTLTRCEFIEESYFTYSQSPVHDGDGAVAGILSTLIETTSRVLAERRLKTLRTLVESTAGASTTNEACLRAVAALAGNPQDLGIAVIYSIDKSRNGASLVAATGVEAGCAAAPHWIDLRTEQQPWPISRALERPTAVWVEDLSTRFPELTGTAWPEPLRSASVLPLRPVPGVAATAVLIVGSSPRLVPDASYRDFFEIVASRISSSLAEATAREHERERLDRLNELDRTRMEFFANVSHEFRTPLTLLLAPLEDLLRQRDGLSAAAARDLDIASRNAKRLLGLVNSLLDFSQIESRRRGVAFEEIDLREVTADVASAFRSAVEAAGLELRITCEDHLPPVVANREMWERIVSNLLSNAFKFTFEGEICVALRALSLHAELVVSDTGIGIAADELPNIFKRFHRVRGARARTAEGSGIGLALVEDFVKRLGGQIRVESTEGRGTTFTIWLPYKSVRAVAQANLGIPAVPAPAAAPDLAIEALRWVSAPEDKPDGVIDVPLGPSTYPKPDSIRGRIVVVDDNADMRDYLQRLLEPYWDVTVSSDGEAGLRAVESLRPNVLLADVMMPNLDGFELLKRVREDPRLTHMPVVLVTARAGEEAAIEGLLAGADDYVAKPFSPRELVVRVQAAVDRARADSVVRESREQLAHDLEDAKRLASVSSVLIKEEHGEELYGHIIEAAMAVMDADFGSIQVVNEQPRVLRLLASRNFHPESAQYWSTVSINSGTTCAATLVGGERVIVSDIEAAEHQSIPQTMEHYRLTGIRSLQSTPLTARDGTLVGVISTHWRVPHTPAERELQLIDILARQAADFFERRRDQLALRQRAVWLRGQREALELAVNDAPLESSLGALVRTAVNALGDGIRAAFYLADANAQALHHVVGMNDEYAKAVDGFKIGPESLACGLAAHAGQAILTPDVLEDERWKPWCWLAERFGYRGCWSFPVHSSAGTFVGSFALYSPQPRVATDSDIELATVMVHTASIILSRHREAEARKQAERALLRANRSRHYSGRSATPFRDPPSRAMPTKETPGDHSASQS